MKADSWSKALEVFMAKGICVEELERNMCCFGNPGK